jgi:DNA-binding YbaB/EbfC family protein
MTESSNPFEALGGGGFDMNALLQQAQQLQEQLVSAQEQLAEQTVEGSVAGGAVTVTVSGVGDLRAVAIRPGTVEGDDEESLSDLGDLVVAAFRDAKAKADALAQSSLGPLAGGAGAAGGEAPGGPLGFGPPSA